MRARWQWGSGAVLLAVAGGGLLGAGAGEASGDPVSAEILRDVRDVRELRYEEAKGGPPVELRVTVISHLLSGFDGQDETGGMFFQTPDPPPVGQRVEVFGNVTGGLYQPYIVVDEIRTVGPVEHPKPLKWLPEFVLTGAGDNRWIEVEGLLADIRIARTGHWAEGVLLGGPVELGVRFRNHHREFDAEALRALRGAWVRMRGSGAPLFNDSRQRIGAELICPGLRFMTVGKKPDLAALPLTPLGEIRSWNYRQERPSLVRTRGTVTWMGGEENRVVLQDGEVGAPVRGRSLEMLRPGDVVEMTGFPESAGFSVGLRFAEASLLRRGMPLPEAIADRDLPGRTHALQRVRVRGRLAEKGDAFLSLQTEEALVPVRWRGIRHEDLPPVGSELEVEAVKWVDSDRDGTVGAVSLVLNGAGDLRVLARPSWWTPRRSLAVTGLLGGGMLGVLGWSGLLRRRVRAKTAEVQCQIEANAALEERNRIARELHDTLSQGFSGVGYQLASVGNHLERDPHRAREKLETARRMVEHSLTEARGSLAALRSGGTEAETFENRLQGEMKRLDESNPRPCEVVTDLNAEALRELSRSQREDLLRVVLEAVSNARRHAGARRVRIRVERGKDGGRAEVSDDGCGFEPGKVDEGTHFGVLGMRERAARMGSELQVWSRCGEGTRVELKWPRANGNQS